MALDCFQFGNIPVLWLVTGMYVQESQEQYHHIEVCEEFTKSMEKMGSFR